MVRLLLKTILTFCLCIATIVVHAKEKRMSLRRALKDKLVEILPVSTGGYCNKGLSLEVKNISKETLSVSIESGMEFKPKDTSIFCQPLILLGDELLVLSAGEQKNMLLQTFCGNSEAHSPYKGIFYTFSRMQDSNLINVLRYAKRNSIPPELVQRAVWAFTNQRPLRSVYLHDYPSTSAAFVKYVATIKKKKEPAYYLEYALSGNANGPIIARGREKVYVNMSWGTNEGYRNVHVSVYKSGEMYKSVGGISSDKNGSTAVVELNTTRDRAGTYTVRLHDDANNILQEKVIVLGATDDDESY